MGSLGWPEILMILVVALIIFGPRKLPELGKTIGQSLAQFRRASEDFKRTWEEEVEIEKRRIEAPPRPYERHRRQ
jgi:TatA/E family protein of Tat protein translocase